MEIKYTGLRPGEKLYEELLMAEEGLQDTENKLIHIGKPIEFEKKDFEKKLEILKETAYDEDAAAIKALVKEFVPTYKPGVQRYAREITQKLDGMVKDKPYDVEIAVPEIDSEGTSA